MTSVVVKEGYWMTRFITNFICDEKAAEVTELAIVFALIVAGSIIVISSLGGKIQQYYQSTNTAIP